MRMREFRHVGIVGTKRVAKSAQIPAVCQNTYVRSYNSQESAFKL